MGVEMSALEVVALFYQRILFLLSVMSVLEVFVKKRQLIFFEIFMLMKILKVFIFLIFYFLIFFLFSLSPLYPAPEEKRRAKDGRLEKVQMC